MRQTSPRMPALLIASMLAWLAAAPGASATDAAMAQSLQTFFAQGVTHDGARAELVHVQRWPDASGALRWTLPALRGHPAQLFLTATQGKGPRARRWYVPVRVRWWAKAVVAREDIPARAVLSPSMLTVTRANVAGHAGRWWRDPQELAGVRANHDIAKGEVVFSSSVRRPPLVQRGREVVILARIGGVRVTALGKALRAANAGETVPVRNLRSKQVIQARVVDAHTVRVVVGGA